jgi:hypothetical protein
MEKTLKRTLCAAVAFMAIATAALAGEPPKCRAPEIPDAASLERLSEETGFSRERILVMEKEFCDANGDANALVPLLRSVHESWVKAHLR